MSVEEAGWKADPNIVMLIRKHGDYRLTLKERENFLKRAKI